MLIEKEYIRKHKWQITGLVLLLLVVAMVVYRGLANKQEPRKAPAPVQVAVYELQKKDMIRHISLSGKTIADATIALAPKYAGKVVQVNAKLGDRVSEGQILVVQDTGDLDIAIQQGLAATEAAGADAVTEAASYEANYLRTEAVYDIQKKHYERQQYLLSIGAISQDTLDNARDQYVTAKAAFEALANQSDSNTPASVRSKQMAEIKNRYAVAALEKQREDMILRAPRSGVIGYREVEVGSYLTAGSKILTLVDNNNVYVDCSLSENDAAILDTGREMEVSIDSLGKSYKGKLVYVSPAMAEDSKAYVARIALEVPKNAIKAGLFARGAIDIIQRENTFCVPKEAVMTKNGKTSIYVYNQDTGTVEERMVTLGLLNDEEVEIISGATAGDLIIITNQDRLQVGQQVILKADN